MARFRRSRIAGGTYFFTVVTCHRYPLLADASAISVLHRSFEDVTARHPFTMDALVILPDHVHCIWTLPEGDSDFSTRWRQIKSAFSLGLAAFSAPPSSSSRLNKRERPIWQRRFWEHTIRDERDFQTHCDYIHYNPVKHGYVRAPGEWQHSTFRDYLDRGLYDPDWGQGGLPEVMGLDFE